MRGRKLFCQITGFVVVIHRILTSKWVNHFHQKKKNPQIYTLGSTGFLEVLFGFYSSVSMHITSPASLLFPFSLEKNTSCLTLESMKPLEQKSSFFHFLRCCSCSNSSQEILAVLAVCTLSYFPMPRSQLIMPETEFLPASVQFTWKSAAVVV